jgi:DnaJ-class molecular chaperone
MPVVAGNSDKTEHLKTVQQLAKGDLYIRFDIYFPKKISNEHKKTIVAALRQNAEDNNL